jgi:ribonuclease-3
MELTLNQIRSIEVALGYVFQDKALLQRAMTRKAYALEQWQKGHSCKDQEEYCILGDAVLKLILIDVLRNYGYSNPGTITQQKQQLEKREYLGRMPQAIAIAPHLLMNKGEKRQAVEQQTSVRGKTLEAVIAAIREDAGYDITQQVVSSWFTSNSQYAISGNASPPAAGLRCHLLRVLRARRARKTRNKFQNENCCWFTPFLESAA